MGRCGGAGRARMCARTDTLGPGLRRGSEGARPRVSGRVSGCGRARFVGLACRSETLRSSAVRVGHGCAHRTAERGNGGLVRDVDGRADRAWGRRNAEITHPEDAAERRWAPYATGRALT